MFSYLANLAAAAEEELEQGPLNEAVFRAWSVMSNPIELRPIADSRAVFKSGAIDRVNYLLTGEDLIW